MPQTLPAYLVIKQNLMKIIRSAGDDMLRIPSEREMCRLYGVSRPTVRRAMESMVKDGLLMPRRGRGTYVRQTVLVEHENKRTANGTIGIVFYDGAGRTDIGEFGWGILRSIIRQIRSMGKRALIIPIESHGLLAAEEIIGQDIPAVIWVAPTRNQIETIEYLEAHGIAVVSVNRDLSDHRICSVFVDGRHGGFLAADHLIELGHKRILFIGIDHRRDFQQYRLRGFHDAHAKHGISHDRELLLDDIVHTIEVYHWTNNAIATKEFSSVFVADGIYTLAVMQALRDQRKSVPDDFSLVIYDRIDRASIPFPLPTITTIEQPLAELGKIAATRANDFLHGTRAHKAHLLKPELAKGDSCRQLAKM